MVMTNSSTLDAPSPGGVPLMSEEGEKPESERPQAAKPDGNDSSPNTPAKPESAAPGSDAQQPAEAAPARDSEEQTVVAEPQAAPTNRKWYVVKVQSGREESIKEAIERRVKIEGLEEQFGQII